MDKQLFYESFRKNVRSTFVLGITASALYGWYNYSYGKEDFYQRKLLPAMEKLDPEFSHKIAIKWLKFAVFKHSQYVDTPVLAQNIKHLTFRNPIGMAAGFDKNGEVVVGLDKLGFGFVEVGSVTPLPQSGNDKPRVFKLPQDRAIINRYGFNSDGHEAVYKRLKKLRDTKNINCILGVNLGKNKTSGDEIDDYVSGVKLFSNIADYFAINVSSPNTPGLRDLQKKDRLRALLTDVIVARNELPVDPKPLIFLKLSPDLTNEEKKDIASVIKEKNCQVDGLIISNTTVQRNPYLLSEYAAEMGGLSGEPLKSASTTLIAEMYKLTKGSVPIIGVGGIFNGADAYDKIKAGASLIQIYTAFTFKGPPVITEIKQELYTFVTEDNYGNIKEAVGRGSK